jgi:hypothetical protein
LTQVNDDTDVRLWQHQGMGDDEILERELWIALKEEFLTVLYEGRRRMQDEAMSLSKRNPIRNAKQIENDQNALAYIDETIAETKTTLRRLRNEESLEVLEKEAEEWFAVYAAKIAGA